MLPSSARYVAHVLLGAQPQGVVVSDRYAAYAYIDVGRRQVCWAHLLRDLINHSFPQISSLKKHDRAAMAAHTGLVVTMEDHRLRDTRDGRQSRSICHCSGEKIKCADGEAVT
jgi:hypothetical protein